MSVTELNAFRDSVYHWLVYDMNFPFDFTTYEKPPWLDVYELAKYCWEKEADGRLTVGDYVDCIYEYTEWTCQA